MPNNTDGSWDTLKQWPLIGLHAIVMDDGRVLTFGTDARGMQGAQFIYDIYDPKTGEHQTLENKTPTDIFCSAAMIIPGTNKILIAGGDARTVGSPNKGVADVNILDMDTGELYPAPDGDMAFQRWYPTMVSLPDGRMVMLGGSDINGRGIATPEIYTYGEGWKTLTGATDGDIGNSSSYPRAFVNADGDIVYMATGKGGDGEVEVMKLNVDGNGSITQIGTVPFNVAWDAPAVMYEAGKMLIQDAQTGLWSVDINGDSPKFEKVATLSQERNWSNMTTLADGTVLINGGTSRGNTEAGADKTAVIWDPSDNSLTYTVDEVNPRLYHSASVLLNDGTLLSLGGGSAGMAENNYLDGQVYRPPYLYDANGNLADRPVITDAPVDVDPGETFTIKMDNVSDIGRLTFVQNGAATHALNMGTRMVELEFTKGPGNTLEIKMPKLADGVTAGSWMLFAWDSEGVPSVAPTINVNPVFDTGGNLDPDNLLDNGSFEVAGEFDNNDFRTDVFGWESSKNNFELWKDGFEGIKATDGKTFIEVDAERGTISQSVDLQSGQKYELSFDYTGRPGFVSSSAMEVLWNGKVVATITPDSATTVAHKLSLIGIEGKNVIAFRSLDSDTDSVGGLLDNVSLKLARDTDPVPGNLLVNGNLEATEMTSDTYYQGYDNTGIPGWKNEAANYIELVRHNGTQALDLDAAADSDVIYQDVQTKAGQNYNLSFDVIREVAGTSDFDVLWNGKVVARVSPTAGEDYSFSVVGTGGMDRLAFREVSGQNNYDGAYLDNITLLPGGPTNSGDEVADIPNETQYLNGVGDKDTFVIAGKSSDYGWGATQDGQGIVVWGPTGHDLLYGFEKIKFSDTSISLTSSDGKYQDVANVTQFLTGTKAQEETFVINGNSADYDWGTTQDGQGIVVWGPTGADLLYDFDKIAFNDRTVELGNNTNPDGGLIVNDDTGRVQFETGTIHDDRFVIAANASDYNWGATQDGQGIVVWNQSTGDHDILYDFEEIQFNDQVVQIDQAVA